MDNSLDPIDVASQFVKSDNRAIFNDWFYAEKGILTAYCGTFVSYCKQFGGNPLGRMDYMKGFASVPFAVKYFRDKNQLTTKPKRNDIVFFDWTGKKDITNPQSFEHTGLFEKDIDGITFYSIEGNTSSNSMPKTANQSNSGWVERKIRPYTVAIFAH